MTDHRLPPSRFAAGHTIGSAAPRATINAAPSCPAPDRHGTQPSISPGPEPTNTLAIVSFVLAASLGPLGAPAAVPMALSARRQCAVTRQRGAGLATVSMFVALAYLALAAVVLMLFLTIG